MSMRAIAVVTLAALGCGTARPVVTAPEASGPAPQVGPLPPPPPQQPGPSSCDLSFWTVDWPLTPLIELNHAVQKGTVIVAFDCHEVTVLGQCSAQGNYAFAGKPPQAEHVAVKTADEAKSSFPLTGASIAADIALGGIVNFTVMEGGTWISPRETLDPGDLSGACANATHYVRRAHVGADNFSITNNVGGTTSRTRSTAHGSLARCGAVNQSLTSPPRGCDSIQRIELAPLR